MPGCTMPTFTGELTHAGSMAKMGFYRLPSTVSERAKQVAMNQVQPGVVLIFTISDENSHKHITAVQGPAEFIYDGAGCWRTVERGEDEPFYRNRHKP